MVTSRFHESIWSRGKRRRVAAALVSAALPASLIFGSIGAPSAAAAVRTALIDGATVTGSPSLEEQAAVAAGFTVTIVPDATWATYTASDFGQYDLLIAGDPFCGTLPAGLVSSASVWGSVVLGTAGGRTQAGNRIIVGTDPELHSGANPGAITLINEGVAFAGAQVGRTGMYLDTTCAANYFGQSAETLTVVNAISSPAASGTWTIDANPPCGGNVSLIASVPGSFPTLTTADLEGWGCSVHESFPTFTSDFAALAVATDTTTAPTCGIDPGTGLSACGEAYILIAGSGIIVTSGSISLTPTDATNPVGTDHTVTAHVTDGSGAALVGQLVAFSVTGINAGATGTCVPVTCATDPSGNVTFTYHDTNGAGDDTIKASFTDATGSLQEATAQKHWVVSGGPHTTLTESASPTSGRAPLAVTYTYSETNDGTDPISGVTVSGSSCGTATYASGDSNGNSILDPGETWVYTCSITYASAGTVTDTATASGTDTATSLPAPAETASASVTVTNPHTTLTESASPTSGVTPLAVTYTYSETNDGTDPISGVTVSGSSCGTAAYASGDSNGNSILDPGETWVYTCSITYASAGTVTDTATASGTDTVDSLPAPAETASASVTAVTPGAILPTNTECSDFVNNTTPALTGIFYKVSGGTITQSINPGAFFYYTYVTTTVADQTVTTSQHATNSAPLFTLNQGHAWLYTATCGLVSNSPTLIGTPTGSAVSFTIATPGTYVLRLQYSTKSIAGKTAPTASPSLYSFDINGIDNAWVPLTLQ